MKSRLTWTAVLIALLPLYPLLHFYTVNSVMVSAGTVAVLGAGAVLCALLIGAATGALTKRWSASMAAAGVLVFLLLANGHFRMFMTVVGIQPAATERMLPQVVLHVLILAATVGVWFAVRHSRKTLQLLAAITVVLLLIPILTLFGISGTNTFTASSDENPPARTTDPGVTVPDTGVTVSDEYVTIPDTGLHPHFLILLLDGYARADVLRDVYRFDNSGFVAALRDRGFFVADSAATNYSQTLFVLTGMFNMRPLPITDDGPLRPGLRGNAVRKVLLQRYRDAAVWRLLGDAGYLRIATSMYGMPAPRGADVLLRNEIMDDIDLGLIAEETSWIFLRKLLAHDPGRKSAEAANEFLDDLLRITVRSARDERPTMLFAHVLAPHPPFTLAAGSGGDYFPYIKDGSHYHEVHGTRPEDYVERYRRELPVLNARVLEAVDDILASDRPLVLVIMSDHGPGAYLDWEDVRKTNLRERMASFFAVYSSHGDVTHFPHRITPVNIFPLLFNSHFGTRFPLHENRAWFSRWSSPQRLHDASGEVW